MRILALFVLAAALLPPVQRCDEESAHGPNSPSGAPVLTSITPPQASVGDTITLKGSGFSAKNTGVKISSGYANATTSASDTALTFTLPATLSACPPGTEVCVALAIPVVPGTHQVAVVNEAGASNALPLQVVRR